MTDDTGSVHALIARARVAQADYEAAGSQAR